MRDFIVRVNVDEAARYYGAFMALDALVTDLTAPASDGRAQWDAARAQVPAGALVGTYLSSRDVLPDPARDPAPRFPSRAIASAPGMKVLEAPGGYRVFDYSDPPTRLAMLKAAALAAETRRRDLGTGLLYMDNFSDEAMWPFAAQRGLSWRRTTDLMREYASVCRSVGVRVWANVAYSVGTGSDVQLLAGAADGITLEMALTPDVCARRDWLDAAIRAYAVLTGSGMAVTMIPVVRSGKYAHDPEVDFLAAAAASFGCRLAYAFTWDPRPEIWFLLERLGKRIGSPSLAYPTVTTKFERGTVQLDCSRRVAETTWH